MINLLNAFKWHEEKLRYNHKGKTRIEGFLSFILAVIYVILLFGFNFAGFVSNDPVNGMVLVYLLIPSMVAAAGAALALHRRTKGARNNTIVAGLTFLCVEVLLSLYTLRFPIPILSLLIMGYGLWSKRLIATANQPDGKLSKVFLYFTLFLTLVNMGLFIHANVKASTSKDLQEAFENAVLYNNGQQINLEMNPTLAQIGYSSLSIKQDPAIVKGLGVTNEDYVDLKSPSNEELNKLFNQYTLHHKPLLAMEIGRSNLGAYFTGSFEGIEQEQYVVFFQKNYIEIGGMVFAVVPKNNDSKTFFEAFTQLLISANQ